MEAGNFRLRLDPDDDSNSEIDAVSIDGKHSRRLVSGFYSPNGLDVSPDGKHIAYTSYVGWGYDVGATAYVARTDAFDSHVVHDVVEPVVHPPFTHVWFDAHTVVHEPQWY